MYVMINVNKPTTTPVSGNHLPKTYFFKNLGSTLSAAGSLARKFEKKKENFGSLQVGLLTMMFDPPHCMYSNSSATG